MSYYATIMGAVTPAVAPPASTMAVVPAPPAPMHVGPFSLETTEQKISAALTIAGMAYGYLKGKGTKDKLSKGLMGYAIGRSIIPAYHKDIKGVIQTAAAPIAAIAAMKYLKKYSYAAAAGGWLAGGFAGHYASEKI